MGQLARAIELLIFLSHLSRNTVCGREEALGLCCRLQRHVTMSPDSRLWRQHYESAPAFDQPDTERHCCWEQLDRDNAARRHCLSEWRYFLPCRIWEHTSSERIVHRLWVFYYFLFYLQNKETSCSLDKYGDCEYFIISCFTFKTRKLAVEAMTMEVVSILLFLVLPSGQRD